MWGSEFTSKRRRTTGGIQQKPLTTALGFDQEHKKSGASGRRYEAYKAAKTVGEYKQLNPVAF